ncbi:hypothetical protein [Flavobacterium sp. '19STA2R22 D10 B1']|uniref:hypothetical protein n=1 Tax=Flavobacterium aerium TaxID=3037261 RepID=UPI00278BDABD|nr:hypothetical protein [Flavobacterium sp. '19STA2R22 D10 B1']
MRKIILLSVCFIYGIQFGQVPHGSIHVDVTFLLKNEITNPVKNKKDLEPLLLQEKISIFPAYASIGVSKMHSDSLIIGYSTDPIFIMFEEKNLPNTNENSVGLRDGWVNFSYLNNNYYVTKLVQNGVEMMLYLYTGVSDSFFKNKQPNLEITNVYYDKIKFNPGTYVIDLHNKDSFVSKKLEKNEDVSNYYNIGMDGYLVIKNEAIILSKVSNTVISPEELQKAYKTKNFKNNSVLQKILRVYN